MKTYAVLLRGVMPTGKNKVPMARLRDVLANAGFDGVQTYIQTGNIVLATDLPPAALQERVRELIRAGIGPDLPAVARTGTDLKRLLDGNPFRSVDQSRVFYALFQNEPSGEGLRALREKDFGPDKISLSKSGAYLYIPGSAARSKLNNVAIEKHLGVSATTRNGNTLRKLIELTAAR